MRILAFLIIIMMSFVSINAQHIMADSPYKKGATFPGGMDSLNSFLIKNIKYPDYLKERTKELEEIIIVEFIVKRSGYLEDVKIQKGKNPAFKREALRLVRIMPNWLPAEIEGKVVDETIMLPIRFRLEPDE